MESIKLVKYFYKIKITIILLNEKTQIEKIVQDKI